MSLVKSHTHTRVLVSRIAIQSAWGTAAGRLVQQISENFPGDDRRHELSAAAAASRASLLALPSFCIHGTTVGLAPLPSPGFSRRTKLVWTSLLQELHIPDTLCPRSHLSTLVGMPTWPHNLGEEEDEGQYKRSRSLLSKRWESVLGA